MTMPTPEKSGGSSQFKTTVLNDLEVPKGQIVELFIAKKSSI